MSSPSIPGRGSHRVRTRGTPAPPIEWDILQALLGFTYTLQQEAETTQQPEQSSGGSPVQDSNAALKAALQRIALSAQNLTEAEGAAIALGTGRSMVCVARTGVLAPAVGTELDARTGLAGDCVRLAEPAISLNTEADARVEAATASELGVRSILYLPIRSDRNVLGILGVFASRPWHFSERDLTCLKFTEALIVEALQRAEGPQENVLESLLKQVAMAQVLAPRAVEAASIQTLGQTSEDASNSATPPAAATIGRELGDQQELPVEAPAPPIEEIPVPLFAGYAQQPAPRMPLHWARVAAIVVLVILVLAAAALALRKMRKVSGPTPAQVALAPPSTAQPNLQAQLPGSTEFIPSNVQRATWITPRVRFWSEPGHAVVTVTLDNPSQYEGHRLSSPDRVYFDLDENIVSAQEARTFAADTSPVERIRIAQFRPGTSRIVFDVRGAVRYSSELASDPNRLVIDMYSEQTKPMEASPRRATPSKTTAVSEVAVVIDPGHGGHDLGTVGRGGLQEKDLTLDVAMRLGRWLEQKLGARVVYTRATDDFVPLEQRVAVANQAHANFFVSIHANGSSYRAVHGVETFYFNSSADALETASRGNQLAGIESGAARRFAADVQHALLAGLSDGTSAVRDRGVKSAHFVVLRGAEMPAVLAEISFVTSADDERRLRLPEYRERIAKALFRGIASHVRRQMARSRIATLGKTATGSQP